MRSRALTMLFALCPFVPLFALPALAADKPTTRALITAGGAGAYSPWGSPAAMQYPQLTFMIAQLNMTPDFTLDKETKQKLADIQSDYQKAQTKFMADSKDEMTAIQQEQMEAFKSKDQEKIQAASRKYAELFAKGPKADDYLARTKAALPPEQLKIVEEKLKAQMEQWQKMREQQAPGLRKTPESDPRKRRLPMRKEILGIALTLAGVCSATGRADEPVVELKNNTGKMTLVLTPATGSATDPQYFQLLSMLTQMNMTPDFTLDKETKQKLTAVEQTWRRAQAKFMEESGPQLKAIEQEQAQAAKANDSKASQAAARKYMQVFAKSPKAGDYVMKLKAALPPEQLQIVEAKVIGQGQGKEALYQYDAAGGSFTEKRVEEKK